MPTFSSEKIYNYFSNALCFKRELLTVVDNGAAYLHLRPLLGSQFIATLSYLLNYSKMLALCKALKPTQMVFLTGLLYYSQTLSDSNYTKALPCDSPDMIDGFHFPVQID